MAHDHFHSHVHESAPSAGGPGRGHNHRHDGAPDHLHSHAPTDPKAEAVQALTAEFIEGFKAAADKAAYLRIAGVPLEIDGDEGAPPLKLVDVSVESRWAVGAASPAFGSRELSYLPYPGSLIRERTQATLVYVSLDGRRDVDVREFLAARAG